MHSFYQPVKNNYAIVSIPNAGHIKILTRMANALKQSNPKLNIHFILTSWLGHEIQESYIHELKRVANQITILESINTANSKGDTFGRAKELIEQVVNACQNVEIILYDFMTIEGALAGKILSLPTICVEPSYVGKFDCSSNEYQKQIQQCAQDIFEIENTFNVNFQSELKLVSGALSLHSKTNILFSWEQFTRAGDFEQNNFDETNQFYFARPITNNIPLLDNQFSYIQEENKKIIYFSLGTIASGIAWDETKQIDGHSLQSFIKLIYTLIINIAAHRNDFIFILSTGRNSAELIVDSSLPNNIHTYESLDQTMLLHHVDLFISHCGANSINEAIDAQTRIIGIPLMFDQHQCASALHKLGLGHAYLLSPEQAEKAVYLENNTFFRNPFDNNNFEKMQMELETMIDNILSQDFSLPFQQVKLGNTQSFDQLNKVIKNAIKEYKNDVAKYDAIEFNRVKYH